MYALCRTFAGRGASALAGRAAALAVLALLAACSHHDGDIARVLRDMGNEAPRPGAFHICYDYGCKTKARAGFSAAEWEEIAALFPAGLTAAAERARLRRAIALMERFTGARTGTGKDLGGSFPGFGRKRQMDCIDEMANTATYIRLLERAGLMVHHTLHAHQYQGFFATRVWPHAAISIRETATGAIFVVDSWWLDNGAPPYVVAYDDWWGGNWRERYDAMDAAAAGSAGPRGGF